MLNLLGKRISFREKVKYDSRVSVQFQKKAWSDENVMKHWVKCCWKPACQGRMHLVLDVHRAQKTEAVIDMLQTECLTDVTYVPGMSL